MINQHQFQQAARHFRSGRISLSEFQARVYSGQPTPPHQTKSANRSQSKPAEKNFGGVQSSESPALPRSAIAENVTLDLDRARRCGWSEVVYGEGKSIEMLVEILNQLSDAGQPALVTRVSSAVGAALAAEFDDGQFHLAASTFTRGSYQGKKNFSGDISIVAAGSSDLPVLEEAAATVRWMGGQVNRIVDVGVAGPDRLRPHLNTLKSSAAIVVVAGMEGALPSVVAGHVGCPVLAVPTSVGYGANLGGIAAFLSMVNSCAANVAVVNIDAGFKAGYLAAMVACED